MKISARTRKNFHYKETDDVVIKREIYLNKIISKKYNGLSKVMTGMNHVLLDEVQLLGEFESARKARQT